MELVRKEAEFVVKVVIMVPKSFADYCKTKEAKEKPYNICQLCPFISECCDGPRFDAMEYKRWAEWASDFMKKKGMTKSEVSKSLDMPLSTVSHALSGSGYDVRAETKTKITSALLGTSRGRYPCCMAAFVMAGKEMSDNDTEKQIADYETEIERLNAELKRVRERADTKVREAKEEAQVKIDNLKKQVEDWKGQVENWKQESREKSATISDLMNMLIKYKTKE